MRLSNTTLPVGRRTAVVSLVVLVGVLATAAFWSRTKADPTLVAVVRRGGLTSELTATGALRPIQSLTYRSPLVGRDAEIIELAPEGTRVNEGDLIARLDTTDLRLEVERLQGELRQMQMELQVAEGERDDAAGTLRAVSEGEGALTVEEIRTRLQLTQKKVERLRQEYEQLKPLMDKGFITREELGRTTSQLEEAEEELALARRRTDVAVQITHPREKQRAIVQLAQKEAQVNNVRTRMQDTQSRLAQVQGLIESCSIYARQPGLVVYEENLASSPRRKVRVGDRVTTSQGLVTIPEVDRMLVETTVGEAEVHRLKPGQTAMVRLEAFPEMRLTGKVVRVGTLASASIDRPIDDKRFDLIVELDASTAELRPQMTARADITVGTRDDVLLMPVNAVFEEQGRFVAHVLRATGIESRPIDLGESNDRVVEIVTGLQEGDRVLLSDPGSAAAPAPTAAREQSRVPRERPNVLQPR